MGRAGLYFRQMGRIQEARIHPPSRRDFFRIVGTTGLGLAGAALVGCGNSDPESSQNVSEVKGKTSNEVALMQGFQKFSSANFPYEIQHPIGGHVETGATVSGSYVDGFLTENRFNYMVIQRASIDKSVKLDDFVKSKLAERRAGQSAISDTIKTNVAGNKTAYIETFDQNRRTTSYTAIFIDKSSTVWQLSFYIPPDTSGIRQEQGLFTNILQSFKLTQ